MLKDIFSENLFTVGKMNKNSANFSKSIMCEYEWLHDPQKLKTNLIRKINFPYITYAYMCIVEFPYCEVMVFLSFGIRKVENLII